MMTKAEEPLSIQEKLIFFFLSVLVKLVAYGTKYKIMGFHKKARQMWYHIYAGIVFYIGIVIIIARIIAIRQQN